MKYEKEKCISQYDGLTLERAYMIPDGDRKGIVYISHGMSEHKERYEDFMHYLAENGYVVAIHDHRGHGGSVITSEDLGYFYTEDEQAIVEDLHQMIQDVKNRFPNLPVTLFSHSMGTLVARNYIKKYDFEIDQLILCGPPTKNAAVGLALWLTELTGKIKGRKYRSSMIHSLVFGSFDKKGEAKDGWLTTDLKEVQRYQADKLCGFQFTTNGFLNLFRLLKNAYNEENWVLQNPSLPIFMIAGEEDPVIQSPDHFFRLQQFLRDIGYQHVIQKLYKTMRHELLNEKKRNIVFHDILEFINQYSE